MSNRYVLRPRGTTIRSMATRSTTTAATTSTASTTTSTRAKAKITYADASTQTIACPPVHGVKRTRNALKTESQIECQICWDPIAKDSPMGFLESCPHVFCAPCLVTWNTTHSPESNRHQRCPVCRSTAKRVVLWPRPFESSKEKEAIFALQKRWIKNNFVSQSEVQSANSLRNFFVNDVNLLNRFMNVSSNANRAPRANNVANIPEIVLLGRIPPTDPRLASSSVAEVRTNINN